MNICIIGERINLLCGVGRPAIELAQELTSRGNEVTIISSKLRPEFEEMNKQLFSPANSNVEILRLTSSLTMDLLFKRGKTLGAIQSIVNKADIVHGMDSLTAYGLARSYNFNVPAPIICSSTGLLRLRGSDIANAGVLSLLNIPRPNYLFKFLCPNSVFRAIFNRFNKIIATSQFVAEVIYSLGIPGERVKVIPVSMNTDRFDHIATGKKPPSWDFLYFGWASSIRGFPDALDAFELVQKEHPDASLCVCFPRAHLEDKIFTHRVLNSKALARITLRGFEPNVPGLVQSCGAVVLPFRSPFGHPQPPLALLEAMMLGKPVISTYVGSIPEEVRDNETGFLVQPRDCEALARKMLLTYDEELSKRVGERAQEHIIKTHDVRIVADKTVEVYQDAIREIQG